MKRVGMGLGVGGGWGVCVCVGGGGVGGDWIKDNRTSFLPGMTKMLNMNTCFQPVTAVGVCVGVGRGGECGDKIRRRLPSC